MGGTWDYVPSEAQHNVVTHSHVHHVGNGELSDLGLVYLLGMSPCTVVRANLLHDAYPYYQYFRRTHTIEGLKRNLLEVPNKTETETDE